jgi:pSer/pThr/pTyr-binding forkhead associated (FHA) protein
VSSAADAVSAPVHAIPNPLGTMIKLILTLPSGVLMTHEVVEPHLVIGSGVGSTVVVPDETVAESHVELLQYESGYLVADLVGGGLTKLNGHPVEPGSHYQLETGTQIQLGAVEAVYIAAESTVSVQPVVVESGEGDVVEESESAAEVQRDNRKRPPGGYPAPRHPPGVFVPLKAQRNFWVFASIMVTLVAVAAAGYAGYMAMTFSQ